MDIDTRNINGITYNGSQVTELWVDGVKAWPLGGYEGRYATLRILGNGDILWKNYGSGAVSKTISYSLDDGDTWTELTSSSEGARLSVNAGDSVMLKGTNATYAYGQLSDYVSFQGSTVPFSVEGNIMSLVYGDSFRGQTALESAYTFSNLFGNTEIVSAEHLVLPATTLAESCYRYMFNGCTSLTIAPTLPATALAVACYAFMFFNCTSLTEAPELPATTLASYCYQSMFNGCESLSAAPSLTATDLSPFCYSYMFKGTNLTESPELSAATLTIGCYSNMFYGCSSLGYIKCMATDISATDCTYNWLSGVSASGTFIKNSSMSGWTSGDSGIPNGWEIINDDGTRAGYSFED